jgi:(S)-2-hydroxyglutarate dehydrogenase
MDNISDVIIVGAGIIGLSVAHEIKKKYPGLKLIVLEKENSIAQHQTGHNSGVIHSGIYYKPNSLKAANCIRGYNYLLNFCQEESIPYDICGKIIVAVKEKELPFLNELYNRGILNGLSKIKLLEPYEIKQLEPNITGLKGILVPYSGIVDYKLVSRRLFEKTNTNNTYFFDHKVIKINASNNIITVVTNKGKFKTKYLINCGGLFSDHLAELSGLKLDYRIIPFRGEYYYLNERAQKIINNLVYPVPSPEFPFLGVHFTKKINGKVEAGPNAVLAFKKEGYSKTSFAFKDFVDIISWPGFRKIVQKYWKTGFEEYYRSLSKNAFTRSLQELAPGIRREDLTAGGSGVRAQACDKQGKLIDDFLILTNNNITNVCNAPSPGATASLSIAEEIVNRLKFN